MKILILIFSFLLIAIATSAQNSLTAYIEIQGSIVNGTPHIDPFEAPTNLANKADSAIDFKPIEMLTKKYVNPIKVINSLSLIGWSLVSVTTVPKDNDYPYQTSHRLLYYFKKDYPLNEKANK